MPEDVETVVIADVGSVAGDPRLPGVSLREACCESLAGRPADRGKDGAHQIINRTDSPIRVLMLSSMNGPDIVEYLDTGKIYATSVGASRSSSPGRDHPRTTGKAPD